MKTRVALALSLLFSGVVVLAQDDTTTLRTTAVLDGKGGVQQNVNIVVRAGKVERISTAQPSAGGHIYDLRGLTVLPGLIDTHVHIAWHLGPDGRYQPSDSAPASAMGYAAENAW